MSSETPEQLAVADSGPLIALARIGRFDPSLIAALSILVDRGEAEAIALVQSRHQAACSSSTTQPRVESTNACSSGVRGPSDCCASRASVA